MSSCRLGGSAHYRWHMGWLHRAFRIGAAAAIVLAAAPGRADDARTLRRVHDPVIVRTDRLGVLPTRETRDVVLYRVVGDKAGPIPFQFDARDAKGDVVVDGP